MITQIQYLFDYNIHYTDPGSGRHVYGAVLALDDTGNIALSYVDDEDGSVNPVSGLSNYTLIRR
jgi:hypothetical protein